MPGRDGTGPMGEGPMTGWGRGVCSGADVPGAAGPNAWGYGRGRGRGFNRMGRGGRGRGFGFGRGLGRGLGPVGPVVADVSTDAQLQSLKARAAQLEGALQSVKEQIAAMDSPANANP